MRLRLRVLRNELPAVTTLWPIPDTHLKNTVAQLLHQVNDVFPLEAGSWGFEHYIVTIGGFECLHYHEVGAVCKDDDEVVIRPLQYAEVRARTVLGRDQIAPDGRHLYDGLPFGRPLLRGVIRPEVRIPPRKRRRLELEEASTLQEQNANAGALVRVEDMNSEDDDSEADDEDFEMEEGAESEAEAESEESSSEDESEDDSSDEESDSDTSDTSSDSSSEDESSSEESWDGIDSQPAEPPGKKAASKTALGSRMSTAGSQAKGAAQPKAGERSHAQQAHGGAASSLKRKASADEQPAADDDQTTKKAKVVGTPGEGEPRTQARNARRRDSKKLAHLKEVGVLPPDASLNTLHEWQEGNQCRGAEVKARQAAEAQARSPTAEPHDNATESTASPEKDTSTETLGRSPDVVESSPEIVGTEETQSRIDRESGLLERQRQQLLNQIASGGVDITTKKSRKRTVSELEDDEPPEELSTKQPVAEAASTDSGIETAVSPETAVDATAKTKSVKATDMVPSSVARRSKLDLAGSKRMLFGSLGVRVPKTQEEKDALQKKLTDRSKQRIAPPTEASTQPLEVVEAAATQAAEPTVVEEEDPEAWRDKLDLTAVECCDEGITLSTPPFPFYQRWDPQQRRKKSKARTGKAYMAQNKLQKKRSKDSVAEGGLVESYDKYNQNGEGDALDYDDAAEDEEYWEDGALLNGEYDESGDQDAAAQQLLDETAAQEYDDGFPPLPVDITALPIVLEVDAQKHDYIAYKELVCSAATNWQPSMLTRSAQLQDRDDNGWTMKLAMRDLRPKEYDEEGKRIYSKFEMEGMSDDEEDEDGSVKTVQWAELIAPRLLKRAEKEGVDST